MLKSKRQNNWVLVCHSLTIFLVLCINFLLLPISGGENQYLSFAKQFMDPTWIPNSFSLTEFPGTRLIFQYVFGYPLQFLEFDLCTMLFRIFNFALVSVPLAKIFKHFKLKLFEWLLIFQIFILPNQSLMGREWMFGTFEPKTIAYVFFLWAFLGWFRKKYFQMVVFACLACYFHILVGAWFMVAIGIISLIKGNWRDLIKPGLLFLVLISPFLFYLLPTYFSSEEVDSILPLDYIYVYYRLPHHLGIVKTWSYFMNTHFSGVILTLIPLSFCIYLYRKSHGMAKDLALWVSVCFGICIFFTAIAILDGLVLDRSGGLGLKYYPFRLNSLGYFLLFLLIALFLKSKKYFGITQRLISIIFISIAFFISFTRTYYAIGKDKEFRSQTDYWKMVSFIKENTDKEDAFIFNWKDYNGPHYYNFSRLTNRENFSIYKFVPAEKKKLALWYKRQMALKDLRSNKVLFSEICKQYDLHHIISEDIIEESGFELVFTSDKYLIYNYLE